MNFSLTNEFKEKLRLEIINQNIDFIQKSFDNISYVDITELLYEFDSNDSKYVLDNIDINISSKIISELDEDNRENFLKIYSAKEIAQYLDIIDSDDGADILSELNLQKRNDVVLLIKDPEKSKNLKKLLQYDEDVAGGLMAIELVKCNINWKINQCIELIKKQTKNVENIYSVYVTDDKGKLVGTFGDFSSYSFQASKHLTCGEGGMLTTNNLDYANIARRFTSLGYGGVGAGSAKITKDQIQHPSYNRHVSLGFNYRMSEVQSAVVLGQLERIEELVNIRKKTAEYFL